MPAQYRRTSPHGLTPSTDTPRSNTTSIQLSGATKGVNRRLEAKTRAMAGWQVCTANLVGRLIAPIETQTGWSIKKFVRNRPALPNCAGPRQATNLTAATHATRALS